jgi:PAS domain S-box-containing protein
MHGSELLEALPVAVYTTDAEGRITFFNQAAVDLWGHRPELGTDKWCGSWRIYTLDGRRLPHDECPMAVTLKEGRPVRGVEAIAERPDGSRIRFMPFPTPLRDASGKLTGAINLLMDVTDRHQAGLESARLAAIVTSSDDAIVTKTLEGVVTSWNDGAARIFGYTAEEMIGQPILRVIPPHLHSEEHDILARLRRGEHVRHFETVRRTKEGRDIDISVTVSPLRDSSGKIVGASKVARDITERKQADKLQRLLMDELNHRVKNTLATIQAIASQSLRRSKSPGDFVSSFSGRVQSLARAHDLLTQTKLQGAEIKELVHEQVVVGGNDDGRISLFGPSLMLDAQAAVHLALVLHELATNARKYGALSTPNGRLAIKWELRTNGGRKLILDWKESGGPTVTAPKERGFGSTLIEKTLQSHGGEVSVCYAANGVSSRISMPLPVSAPPNIAMRVAASTDQTTHLLLQPSDKQSTLQGKRIIVIEDEPLVAMDLEASLVAAGCEIAGSVGTIEKARELVANAECDAALIDANLAGYPVDELAAALTQKNIPFAFVTGYGRMALPLGFRDVLMLNKPFGQEQLLAVMEVLLYRNRGVAQLRQKQH